MRVLIALLIAVACTQAPRPASAEDPVERPRGDVGSDAAQVFQRYLDTPWEPADGFDPPVAEGWRRSRLPPDSPYEQWSARKTGAVRASAVGRVVEATPVAGKGGATIVVEHLVFENNERCVVRSSYAGLDAVDVGPGQIVRRGQVLGVVKRRHTLRFALRGQDGAALDPARYLRGRSLLFVPTREPRLLLVSVEHRRLRLYESGDVAADYEVAFGQEDGRKEQRGDLRTPRGMYFVVDRHRGEFTGPTAAYFGGHWLKLNYPNPWDADGGLVAGLVTPAQRDRISTVWRTRQLTDQRTRLGGSIGLHGWASEWDSKVDGSRLSWGCVVMHNADIKALFDRVPTGTMVVIL